MTNNKLTDERVASLVYGSDGWGNFANCDYADIACALRELQERRKADGIYHLPEVYEINGVFTRDVCALANARGAEVQGYVKVEVANRFFRDDKY